MARTVAAVTRPSATRRPTRRRRGATSAVLVALVLLTAATVRATLVVPVRVAGESMAPTVPDGAVVWVWRPDDSAAELARGDLVVLRDPTGALALKRVVGLPGEHVGVLDAVVHLDGTALLEPYAVLDGVDGLHTAQVEVPPGHVFVLGDNRGPSVDSLTYGTVAEDRLVGRVLGG
nr:signal peptidase I [uncultured Actinotalea sp.]